ncbi:hypothetical protein EW145_g4263 [Phellinidium pouzarii]|uniref:Protein kinase domain-containing protein n=1 Tax=Phellinidium pouzarii TaxID=167371 RepID=A0A4S4L4B7_9AGAM|nr:hypothetical protein EW145_g4263 [Phellinidium pouzarii]
MTENDENLQYVINKLGHLNLGGRITFDNENQFYSKGGFGEVYTGTLKLLRGGQVRVAIKRLRFAQNQDIFFKKIVAKELYIWAKLDHKNVLALKGFIIEKTGFPSLISEWMENGTVLEFVKSHPDDRNVARSILGIAEGLAYLHEMDVIHSDMKSDNVLVSSSGDPKICDFGISRAINATQVRLGGNTTFLNGAPGTAQWMAQELILQGHIYTKSSKEADVWAFGMTIYELLVKDYPYGRYAGLPQVIAFAIQKKLPSPPNSLDSLSQWKKEVWRICNRCWDFDPAQRITMVDVVRDLLSFNLPLTENPLETLRRTLDMLSHRNLEGSVTFDSHEHVIYHGGYGELYTGVLRLRGGGQSKVVIKRLRFSLKHINDAAENMARNICVWSKLDHENVLALSGFITEENGFPSLVSEYMEDGTLSDYVKTNPECDVMRLIMGIADGLAYLHENDVIHTDLKPGSVLVSSSGDAKIYNFSISRGMWLGGSAMDIGVPMGSIRWMAYELITGDVIDTKHTKESDVWSFGMTVYEMMAKELPYARFRHNGQVIVTLMRKILPTRPASLNAWPEEKQRLWNICESCWNFDPSQRPTMAEIVKQVKAIRHVSLQTCPNNFASSVDDSQLLVTAVV